MVTTRKDYNRFRDPALDDPSLLGEGCSPIAEDEPFFILRAKDKYFGPMLTHYLMLLARDPETTRALSASVYELHGLGYDWQQANEKQTPDLADIPKGAVR